MAKQSRKKTEQKEQKEIESEVVKDDINSITDQEIQDVGYNPLMDEPTEKRNYTVPKVDESELPHELKEPH